jgi:hypothetical protein
LNIGDYYACLEAWGLTKCRPSYDGATLYQTREREFTTIPDPEALSAEERKDVLALIKLRMGITDN